MATKSELREKIIQKRLLQKLLDLEVVLKRIQSIILADMDRSISPYDLREFIRKVFREFIKARILIRELKEDEAAWQLFGQLNSSLQQFLSNFIDRFNNEKLKNDLERWTGARDVRDINLANARGYLKVELRRPLNLLLENLENFIKKR